MQVIIVREKQTAKNAIQQVNQRIIDRIQTAYKALSDGSSESLVFPIVPKTVQFPKVADVEDYKGINQSFNIPSYKNLEDIIIESIFPVYKDYAFVNPASSPNGWDYVDFLEERQKNKLPLRLIAYDFKSVISLAGNAINATNLTQLTQGSFKRYADFMCVVKDFKYTIDKVKDINYTLTLSQFNSDMTDYSLDWNQLIAKSAENVTTRYALKNVGLI